MVTCFVCIMQRLAYSTLPTRKASPNSCSTITAILWNCKSVWNDCVISHTTLCNRSLLISISVPDWYSFISLRAFNPFHRHFTNPSFLLPLFPSPSLLATLFSLSSLLSPLPFLVFLSACSLTTFTLFCTGLLYFFMCNSGECSVCLMCHL